MNPVSTKTVRNEGFTLIEVMVVLVLLGLGVLGTLGTISKTMTASKAAVHRTLAAQSMRAKVEQLKHKPFNELFAALQGGADPTALEGTLTEGSQTTTLDGSATYDVTTTTTTDSTDLTRMKRADGTVVLVETELSPLFFVQGLTRRDRGAPHGAITILSEADVLAFWGITADFNRDGTKTSPPPATAEEASTWKALPLRIQVQWGAGRDAESLDLHTIILNQEG